MNTSSIQNFDELPLFLNAQLVSRALGVSPSSAYELLHEDGFPSLRIGSRLVVPKEQFRLWVERQTGGTHEEYDAGADRFTDMVQAGILDPVRVTRTALQSALSVSASMLTTEACIAGNDQSTEA